MSEVVTSSQLNKQILDIGHQLQAALQASEEASADYVRVKWDYKKAWNTAFRKAKHAGETEQQAKSWADLETDELARLHDLALERKRNARLVVETWQDLLNARQSIAANARAEMKTL